MKTLNFGKFSERVLELSNHFFSTAYARVYKGYWDNQNHARMRRSYCSTDWDAGTYHTYIPTLADPERNMSYFHISVTVAEDVNPEAVATLASLPPQRLKTPAGVVDSDLIAIIAPHRTKGCRTFVSSRRGPCNVFVAPIITQSPEEAMRRLLKIVTNFMRKRIRALLNSFHLYDWNFMTEERLYYIHSTISKLESISDVLGNAVACMSKTLHWLLGKLGHVLAEIVRQEKLLLAVEKWVELREVMVSAEKSPRYLRGDGDPPILRELALLIAR